MALELSIALEENKGFVRTMGDPDCFTDHRS
jgi:hypothetical protein